MWVERRRCGPESTLRSGGAYPRKACPRLAAMPCVPESAWLHGTRLGARRAARALLVVLASLQCHYSELRQFAAPRSVWLTPSLWLVSTPVVQVCLRSPPGLGPSEVCTLPAAFCCMQWVVYEYLKKAASQRRSLGGEHCHAAAATFTRSLRDPPARHVPHACCASS
jgi:hypothetical protein